MEKTAVLLVDVQNDFCKGGALAVPDGDAVVPVCNKLLELAAAHRCPVLASRDRHPADHCSFKEQGGTWPPHCVTRTPGAEIHSGVELPVDAMIIDKGTSQDKDAYSAFDGTPAASILHDAAVKRLIVCGLATDYCVKFTVLDALKEGFKTIVVEDACRAVNVDPDDGKKALEEMAAAGAVVCELDKIEW